MRETQSAHQHFAAAPYHGTSVTVSRPLSRCNHPPGGQRAASEARDTFHVWRKAVQVFAPRRQVLEILLLSLRLKLCRVKYITSAWQCVASPAVYLSGAEWELRELPTGWANGLQRNTSAQILALDVSMQWEWSLDNDKLAERLRAEVMSL